MDVHRARRKQTFFPHIHPLERFDDGKFISRYRIDKQTVIQMARDFGQSGFCRTRGDTRGAGLTVEERVRVNHFIRYSLFMVVILIHVVKLNF